MLTGKQMETYELVRAGMVGNGKAPTYRQIAAATGTSLGAAYARVSRVCARGWLKRQGRQIYLAHDIPAPTTTTMFDYFSVDYESLTDTGWPRLVDLALA